MSNGAEVAVTSGEILRQQVGGWLPSDQRALDAWVASLTRKVELAEPAELHPVILEFQELIATDPIVRMYMEQMLTQVPKSGQYRQHHLTSIDQMLTLINWVLTEGPAYDDTSMVACPLDSILDWAVCTPAGFAAFRMDSVTRCSRRSSTSGASS